MSKLCRQTEAETEAAIARDKVLANSEYIHRLPPADKTKATVLSPWFAWVKINVGRAVHVVFILLHCGSQF
jgi:hypothetical protein